MKRSLWIVSGLVAVIIGLTCRTTCATTYTNTIAQMTAYITNQMGTNIPGLSIALVDDQTVVWATGFGQADREAEVAANADTVYHIASVSKAFLGTAYMQLRDQGRVDLEAPLTNYMTEFSMLPRFTNSGTVTIRSLLNHHSGLPGDFFNGSWTERLQVGYMDWFINNLQNDYPFAPVNERASYCNSGFVLLSEAVRRITGTNFAAFNEAMIFSPLGMTASSFEPDKAAISNRLAAAYNAEGERQPVEILNDLGSGSMYSSANDQAKYIRMILAEGQHQGQSLVSSNGIDVMTTPQLTNLPLNVTDHPQGLGWDNVDDYRFRYAGKVFWKDGAVLCHCAFLGLSRDLKLGVAVIQNSPGNQCDAIGAEALRWAILDKTGQHWPTNTFVPTPSPVTNLPQTNLAALAGLYVGSDGYYKIVAEPGSLSFIQNAFTDTPVISSNMVPRVNGWFSRTNSPDVQLAFTNLAGHDMLVAHQVNEAYELVSPLGERYTPAALSTAWASRTNRVYRIVNMFPDDYFWNPPCTKTLRFFTSDGALLASWTFGMFVEEPQTDILAFQRGAHYRKGGAIQVTTTNLPGQSVLASVKPLAEPGGFELLRYSSYLFLDEAAIPTLPVSALTNGSIPFAGGTQWYWFSGQTGKTYRARITAPGQEVFLRITDREGIGLASGSNGLISWACISNATYALAVSATNVFDFIVSLTVCGSRQTQSDYDGDGKADPVIYNSSSGILSVSLSGSSYAPSSVIMSVQPSALNLQPVSGDFDGDGKADPALYDPTLGLWGVRFSSQAYALSTMPIGDASCVPATGDYDGDGQADPALYSAASGLFAAWMSGSEYAASIIPLGGAGWSQASEDYDGDGKTDPAVYQTQSGELRVLRSTQGYVPEQLILQPFPSAQGAKGPLAPLGSDVATLPATPEASSLQPAPGDYDNDGKTDPAIVDPAANVFYVWLSGSNYSLAGLCW